MTNILGRQSIDPGLLYARLGELAGRIPVLVRSNAYTDHNEAARWLGLLEALLHAGGGCPAICNCELRPHG
jgi:hypothetical protein